MCADPSKSDAEIIHVISSKGYDPYYTHSSYKITLLMEACLRHRPDVAIAMLTFTTQNINHIAPSGKDALSISIEHGLTPVAMFILNTGLSYPSNHPPLFTMACYNKMSEVAMWLIAHEDPHIYPWSIHSSSMYNAFVNKMPDVASALVNHPSSDYVWDMPTIYSFVLKLAICNDMPLVAMQILTKEKYYTCIVDASVENGERAPPTEQECRIQRIKLPYTGANKIRFEWGFIQPDVHLELKSALSWAYIKRMKDVFARIYSIYYQDIRCVYGNKSTLMMLCHLGLETEALAFLDDARAIPEFKNEFGETAFMFASIMKLDAVVAKIKNVLSDAPVV